VSQPRRRTGAALPADLLRLHRIGSSSLLVLGGSPGQREAMVRAFHRNSLVRGRPLVLVDCGRHEADLDVALRMWLAIPCETPIASNPLRECDHGTLFLEAVGRLSTATQRLLLMLALQIGRDEPEALMAPGPYRLAAGDGHELLEAVARGEFSGALFDALDKVRGEIKIAGHARRGAA
jgi:DNA-binding NtrC family response regulator